MKRIAIFMVALSMVLTLTACGGRKNNTSANNGTSNSGSNTTDNSGTSGNNHSANNGGSSNGGSTNNGGGSSNNGGSSNHGGSTNNGSVREDLDDAMDNMDDMLEDGRVDDHDGDLKNNNR